MKKVLTIVSLSVVGVLLLTTIILACITVGGVPAYATPTGVVVYQHEILGKDIHRFNADESASKITSTMKKGVEQKLLPAIFEGTLHNMKVTTSASRSYVQRDNSEDSVVKFEFKYNEKQTMTVNGTKIEYSSLIFEVKDSKTRDTMKVYAIEPESSGSSGSVPYFTTIDVEGSFSSLYVLVRGLIEAIQ